MRNSEEIMVIRENNTKILELFKKHKEKLKGSLTGLLLFYYLLLLLLQNKKLI